MTKAEYQFHSNKRVFTDGAFIVPMELKKENGETVFMWVVDMFEGDTYDDGECIDPANSASNLEDLIIRDTMDDDEE